jgi:hypothetical protein
MYRTGGTESALYERLAQWLNLQHPELRGLHHFDLGGVNNPSVATRALYSRLNGRGWPDFFLAWPTFYPANTAVVGGLFLELKREGTRIKKQNGRWANTHIEEQADTLERLREAGYAAEFAVGLDHAIEIIQSYLHPPKATDIHHGRDGYHGRSWSSQDDFWPPQPPTPQKAAA